MSVEQCGTVMFDVHGSRDIYTLVPETRMSTLLQAEEELRVIKQNSKSCPPDFVEAIVHRDLQVKYDALAKELRQSNLDRNAMGLARDDAYKTNHAAQANLDNLRAALRDALDES